MKGIIMNIKICSRILALTLIFIPSAFATPSTEYPQKCPSVIALQLSGVNQATKVSDGTWEVYGNQGKFDTNEDSWALSINVGWQHDRQTAIHRGQVALKSLQLISGPTWRGTWWHCRYSIADEDYTAIAMCWRCNEPDQKR